MNYYALFLNTDGFVEKRLSLIRYISNPGTSSLPHITLRLFKGSDAKLDYIKELKVSYLNIIEPGSFNLDGKTPPFVVYIRCESAELEVLEYKPDFPFSRLHITLYEGNDITYAKKLFSTLKAEIWNFKISFQKPISLSERKLGAKISQKGHFEELYKQVLNDDFANFANNKNDNKYKITIIKRLLKEIGGYKKLHKNEIEIIHNHKNDNKKTIETINTDGIRFKENQLTFDSLYSEKAPTVDKQVEDAIYVTPPEYARDMVICALEAFGDNTREIDFGDSAIGTGALFLALKNLVDHETISYKIRSAIGIDVNERMAKEAFARHDRRGLKVIYGDALLPSMNLKPDRNLMIVNPPYNRHGNIPREYREKIRTLAEKQTGISIKGDAGLHAYHLLIMDKWLADGGVASWLLPSIFLQSRYGEAIRQYLLNNVQLIRLHLYDENMPQFSGTDISTTIVTFRKLPPCEHGKIIISFGESVTQPDKNYEIDRNDLQVAIDNWRKTIPRVGEKSNAPTTGASKINFADLFEIKRGLATGANSFFVMERGEAKQQGIPEKALKPLLPKARYLKSLTIRACEDGYPDVDPQLVLIDCDWKEEAIQKEYPLFFNYLQLAKQGKGDEKAVIERTLVKSRKPWYSQEKREPSPFLLTYMGRNKKDLPPLYFILNKSNALALNTYLLLYPVPWLTMLLKNDESLYEKLLKSLNASAESVISQQTRIYSGGLQKLEPGELKTLPIIELPAKVCRAFDANRNLLS